MKAYRLSVQLKLGMIIFAGLIAIASLAYTQRLVERLREREQSVIQLWADAQAQVAQAQQRSVNPYRVELNDLQALLDRMEQGDAGAAVSAAELDRYRQALSWAESMPTTGELSFILNEILAPNPFGVPAIITDSASQEPITWRNVGVPEPLDALSPSDSAEALRTLRRLRADMDETYAPIPIEITFPGAGGAPRTQLRQYVHYDESSLIKELRVFPYVQLLFVGLFILVGYVGFSYVRRSEQSNLWVGMAREAAHQLGTPISSLMGWTEILRMPELQPAQRTEAVDEIEKDVHRLRRVANRFSDIGSMPKMEPTDLAPVVCNTVDYIRRRIPQQGGRVRLDVDMLPTLRAPINEELFAWVVENLLKNALDALDESGGAIDVRGTQYDGRVRIDVKDTGCGIERREWSNVFRPGFSTKKRGWGLGLSLAQRIVEDYHGGSLLLVDSKVGQGSTFRIELPADG
jgi:hypothetical protein